MKVRDLDHSNNPFNAAHAELGLLPTENAAMHAGGPGHPVLRGAMWSVVGLLMALSIALASRLFTQPTGHSGSPVVAGASVHIAEVFTTGVSGIAHLKLGNVNRNLFLRLLVPGMLSAASGAWVLSSIDGDVIKPFISAYVLAMGLYMISNILRKIKPRRPWVTVAGLVLGGLFAAPLAALLTKRLHTKALLALVGSTIVLVSTFNIYRSQR